MANVFKSKQYTDNARFRPDSQNEAEEVTTSIFLPAGYAPTNGDIFVFGILGEGVQAQTFELAFPSGLDTNATPTLAVKFGIVTYAGAQNQVSQTYVGSTAGPASGSEAYFLNGVVVNGAAGIYRALSRIDNNGTGGDNFATAYPVQGTQQVLIATFSAGAATAGTLAANAAINLSLKYQYSYPNQFVTGVTGVSPANLLGNKVTGQAVTYQYGPLSAPNAP